MTEYALIDRPDYWEIPLGGKPVCRFTIDSETKIEFFEPPDEETVIILKGQFTLNIGSNRYGLDAEKPTELCPLFSIYRSVVRTAKAFKNGLLEVDFLDGEQLSAPPDEKRTYESWEIIGARHLRMVCLPSGGIMVWSPDEKGESSDF